jgi:hypothetical protein
MLNWEGYRPEVIEIFTWKHGENDKYVLQFAV